MINKLKNFFKDEEGAGLVEYALLVALIAVACIAAIIGLREGIIGTFDNAASHLPQGQN